jgi:hypothetical protein
MCTEAFLRSNTDYPLGVGLLARHRAIRPVVAAESNAGVSAGTNYSGLHVRLVGEDGRAVVIAARRVGSHRPKSSPPTASCGGRCSLNSSLATAAGG